MVPLIVSDSVSIPLLFRERKKIKEVEVQIPIELRGFIEHFDAAYFFPTAEEALIFMEKEGLFTKPHFIYLFSDRVRFVEEQVITFRRHHGTVLSPLFVNMYVYEEAEVTLVTDGVFKSFSEEMLTKSLEIWEITSKYNPTPYAASLPENKRVAYIRFLTSRKIEDEKPVPHRESVTGFFYPRAYYILGHDERGTEVEDLENLRLHKILGAEIADKTSLCPSCGYYTLVFREVCPSCGSVRIKLVDFIHHYPCGYIGPADEFIKGDRLVCPKCHEELKHIGVDYDKPLEKYFCNDCHTRFFEPEIDVLCVNCKKRLKPEDVETRFIHRYYITSFGKLVAFEGKLPINVFEELSVSLGIINYSAFTYILDKFLRIADRYGRAFCVIGITFSVLDEAFSEIPLKLRSFFKDLVTIIKDNLRASDIISVSEDKFILILLPETAKEGGNRAYSRIQERIRKLIRKNNLLDFIKFGIAIECVPSERKFSTSQEFINSLLDKLDKAKG